MVLPSSPDAQQLLALERLDPLGTRNVSRFSPGVLVKFGFDHEAEVRALQFIHGQLSVRTPRVLPPFPKIAVVEPWHFTEGVWYFFMEECTGVPLDTVIGNMTSTELDHIADQLLVVLDEMRSYKSTTLGAVTGGPYRNRNMPYPWQPPHAFSNVKEYLDYYRDIFLDFCGPHYVDELFGHFPTEGQVHFTHGDLLPHNILVDGSKITAIVDWETAGYYPDFWEYCRMHDCGWMTPAWGRVLARMFPGPPREKEIDAVYRILRDLYYNSIVLMILELEILLKILYP